MTLTYSSYLKLDELLSLQEPLSDDPEHDEMLFIIIHQVYELWFKEILHELDYLRKLLAQHDTPRCLDTLKRILTILKIQVAQLDILETMSPVEFLAFRDRLETASGFQSFQFRELEFVLGRKDHETFNTFPEGTMERSRVQARYQEPSVWDAFLHYLARDGYAIPQDLLARDIRQANPKSPEVQAILIDIYRNNPAIAQICERLVDLDEGFQEWRYRHIKVAERTIGTKRGTAGSTGVQYLMTTLFKPAFPDLWAIRTEL